MVQSIINPSIKYDENKSIEKDDQNMDATPYEITFENIDDLTHIITFGNMNIKGSQPNKIAYFHMYLVVNDKIASQIGIIEFLFDKLPEFKDDDGDLDPEKLPTPLFFKFVTSDNLKKLYGHSYPENNTTESKNIKESIDPNLLTEQELDIENIEDSMFYIPIKDPDQNPQINSVFEIDLKKPQPQSLYEETKQEAIDIRKSYKIASHHEWIQKFMKNINFDIVENEGSGDCFFAVIRDAFQQMNRFTSVQKLRDLLAEEMDEEIFQTQRSIYLDFENNLYQTNKNIKDLTNTLRESKKRYSLANNQEKTILLENMKKYETDIKRLKKEKYQNEIFIQNDFGHMQKLDSIDKFRDYIKSSSYWADSWAISTLEFKLNFKTIIMSEQAFKEDALDSVIKCGEFHPNIEKKGIFNPDFYIVTSYSGNHYRLITYKKKKIFNFKEIPYDIKILVLNKCLEKNAGTYHLIEDFHTMKKRFGFEDDFEDDDKGSKLFNSLYENDVAFMFHEKSEKKAKPGKGSNETIPLSKEKKFQKLTKIDNWRRILDDSHIQPFELDNLKWNSVLHYYNASKYKKGYPDYYKSFSLDSNTALSKDVKLAKLKGSIKGQDKKVKIDPDFYGQRSIQEKQNALLAKFTQNENLKNLLKYTYPAKLLLFRRRNTPKLATDLMEIRRKIIDDNL